MTINAFLDKALVEEIVGPEYYAIRKTQAAAAAIDAAVIPTRPGVIPNVRPKGSTPTQRKQDLKNLITETLGSSTSAYNQEQIESLLEAMAAYVENAIG
jgi:hypothetical protein